MRQRPWVGLVLVGLCGCAEGQFDDDGGGLGDASLDKDVKPVEELAEEADASAPEDTTSPEDRGIEPDGTVALDAMMSDDARDLDASLDTGVVDTGMVDTGVVDTGVVDTGAVDTGPRDTGVVDTGPRDTGPVDTGPVDSGPPAMILCPLLGTPIPITCRSRGGLPACCGPGGICFCEQRTPLGPFCVPCP